MLKFEVQQVLICIYINKLYNLSQFTGCPNLIKIQSSQDLKGQDNERLIVVHPQLWHTKLPILKIKTIGWLKRLNTQFNKPTNQNSVKVPKNIKPTNKKTLL